MALYDRFLKCGGFCNQWPTWVSSTWIRTVMLPSPKDYLPSKGCMGPRLSGHVKWGCLVLLVTFHWSHIHVWVITWTPGRFRCMRWNLDWGRMNCFVHKNNVVNSKLSLNSSQGGQKVPWIGTSLSCSRTLPSFSAMATWYPGLCLLLPHFLAPLPAPMGLVRVSSLSFLELSNSLSSSFHGLQDDHKLSNKELETKYHTNIVTVSHEGTQIRRSNPVTIKKKGVWKVEGTIRMSDLWH